MHLFLLLLALAAAPPAAVSASAAPASAADILDVVEIKATDFLPSRFPFDTDFFGTTPDPDKAGLSCGLDAYAGAAAFFNISDPWLAATLPHWKAAAGAETTRPWTNGFSAPRLLGGIAVHNTTTGTYTPNLDFEVVTRGDDGTLTYNFSRIFVTIDGWLHAKTRDFLLVLDNIPFAFVAPANRYYLGFGMGAAPDDPEEFAAFVGVLATHLVARYGLALVSSWRFRLGTECDGPRIGPSWLNYTAPNPPFVMADGNGGNYTSRVNGLEKYVATYLAVAKVLKSVVPKAAFGPSNMAGISGDVDAGAGGGGGTEVCTSCPYLNEFADRIKAAGAPLDFIAASEYSKWDVYGLAEVQPMADTIRVLGKVAQRATGRTDVPREVHEFGWAGWGHWAADFKASLPMGAYGGSWDMGAYLYQRAGGASRVFHWDESLDSSLNRGVRGRGGNASMTCLPGTTWKKDCRLHGYPLVSAHGWLLSALLHVTGPETGSGAGPKVAASAEFVRDIPVPIAHPMHPKVKSYNHTVGGVKSFAAGRQELSYLVLNFSPNATERTRRRFQLEVSAHDLAQLRAPAADADSHAAADADADDGAPCAGLAVTQQALNRTTAVHDLIEERLFETQTKVEAELRSVDSIGKMATAAGLEMLSADAASWMAIDRRSLHFAAFDGVVSGGAGGGGCVLEFELETPSMLLLRLEWTA